MTQEEKDLLFKDLCARTPYKTKINVDDIGLFTPTLKYIDGITCHFYECAWTKFIDEIKPYLRQMESMTKDEIEDYHNLCTKQWNVHMDDYWYYDTPESIDWFNAHHFDYRGLIEKGLALEAPDGMYK